MKGCKKYLYDDISSDNVKMGIVFCGTYRAGSGGCRKEGEYPNDEYCEECMKKIKLEEEQ